MLLMAFNMCLIKSKLILIFKIHYKVIPTYLSSSLLIHFLFLIMPCFCPLFFLYLLNCALPQRAWLSTSKNVFWLPAKSDLSHLRSHNILQYYYNIYHILYFIIVIFVHGLHTQLVFNMLHVMICVLYVFVFPTVIKYHYAL